MAIRVDRDRLVDWALRAVSTPSFTGSEQAMAELMADTLAAMGLQVQWQQVEEGRANALGTWVGAGGGPSLMFNGHMDTSYSGREPWLRNVRGFQPSAFVQDGRLYGLGISNMKGALACYVEAVSALQDAGVRLRGDLLVAIVVGTLLAVIINKATDYEAFGQAARWPSDVVQRPDFSLLGEFSFDAFATIGVVTTLAWVFSLFLADFFVRNRGRYGEAAIFEPSGVRWLAFMPWVVGFVVYQWCVPTGPRGWCAAPRARTSFGCGERRNRTPCPAATSSGSSNSSTFRHRP